LLPWFWALALILLVVGVGARLVADRWDRERIRDYFLRQGQTTGAITWEPFARWWTRDIDRTYTVTVLSPDGATRVVSCRTSLFGGVYVSEE
jgi:hypothetical protein